MGIGYMELGKDVPWETNPKEKIIQTNAMDVRDGKPSYSQAQCRLIVGAE